MLCSKKELFAQWHIRILNSAMTLSMLKMILFLLNIQIQVQS